MSTRTASESLYPAKQLNFRKLVLVLLPSVRPFVGYFILSGILMLVTTGIQLALPLMVGKIVDLLTMGGDVIKEVYRFAVLYCFFVFAKALFEGIQGYVIQVTGQRVLDGLRCRVFSHIQTLKISFFDTQSSGRLLTRVTNDIKALSELFTASISVLVLDCLIIVGTVVAMFLMDPKLAICILITFPVVIWVTHRFGVRVTAAYRRSRQRLSEISGFLGENVAGMATIRRLGAEEERKTRFSSIVEAHTDAQMDSLRVFAWLQPYNNVLNGLAMGTLIGLGGHWVASGRITLGVFVAFLGYLKNLFQPLRDVVEKYNTVLSAGVSAERIVAILDELPEDNLRTGDTGREGLRGALSFLKVNFHYPNRRELALRDVSVDLKHGESLAVVGRTGSGKSTLMRILLGFYDEFEGRVFVEGTEIRDWKRPELRSRFGVVHQEMYFLAGKLRDNLVLGRSGFSDETLIGACKRVGLWQRVETRGGLDLEVREAGSNLSAGERQMISLARILISETPFLLLDEATSNIDRIQETEIFRDLAEVMRGRTTILIAHRLSTVSVCDRVMALHAGKTEFVGSRAEFVSWSRRNEFFDETVRETTL